MKWSSWFFYQFVWIFFVLKDISLTDKAGKMDQLDDTEFSWYVDNLFKLEKESVFFWYTKSYFSTQKRRRENKWVSKENSFLILKVFPLYSPLSLCFPVHIKRHVNYMGHVPKCNQVKHPASRILHSASCLSMLLALIVHIFFPVYPWLVRCLSRF